MLEPRVAVACALATHDARIVLDKGGTRREVVLAAMRSARRSFVAPTEDEAFVAAIGALWELYPGDDAIRQETAAIGDRNRIMVALVNGVPVDMARVELTPVPDEPLDLLSLWAESAA